MSSPTAPDVIDATYADVLRSRKADFVDDQGVIAQHGAVTIPMTGWPGWAGDLPASTEAVSDAVIETYVASAAGVTATSDNEPYVSAWMPLIEWMNQAIRNALEPLGVQLDGDAYATASCTPTASLEGMAHMDDDTFMPDDSVGIVAIVGEHTGPRVATGQLQPTPFRPMSQVTWTDDQLRSFERNEMAHTACAADQLVIFPQFGQLHAGPAAAHLAAAGPHRQLLVYRARAVAG